MLLAERACKAEEEILGARGRAKTTHMDVVAGGWGIMENLMALCTTHLGGRGSVDGEEFAGHSDAAFVLQDTPRAEGKAVYEATELSLLSGLYMTDFIGASLVAREFRTPAFYSRRLGDTVCRCPYLHCGIWS